MTIRFSCSLWRATALAAATLTVAAGCSTSFDTLLPDRRPDYRKSTVSQPLEIPPDLTASTIDDTLLVPELNPAGSASLSTYANLRSALLGAPADSSAFGSEPACRMTAPRSGSSTSHSFHEGSMRAAFPQGGSTSRGRASSGS